MTRQLWQVIVIIRKKDGAPVEYRIDVDVDADTGEQLQEDK